MKKKSSYKSLVLSKETLLNISGNEPVDAGKVGSKTCPTESMIYSDWERLCTS